MPFAFLPMLLVLQHLCAISISLILLLSLFPVFFAYVVLVASVAFVDFVASVDFVSNFYCNPDFAVQSLSCLRLHHPQLPSRRRHLCVPGGLSSNHPFHHRQK